jgi:hypothetical protein
MQGARRRGRLTRRRGEWIKVNILAFRLTLRRIEDLECDDGGTATGMQFRGTKRSYLDASQGWI